MNKILLCVLASSCMAARGCGEVEPDDADAGDDSGFCEQAFHLEIEDLGDEGVFDFESDQAACNRFEAVYAGDEMHLEIWFEGTTSGGDHLDLDFELFWLEIVEVPDEFVGEIHDGLITAGDFHGEIRGTLEYQRSGDQISGEFDGELFEVGDPFYICFQDLSIVE